MLNALQCVSGLFVFDGDNLATEMGFIQPDVYVKSGDYSLETMNPQERQVLVASKTKIVFVSFLEGWSTTRTIAQLNK